jgi:hypothetical protein
LAPAYYQEVYATSAPWRSFLSTFISDTVASTPAFDL